MHSLKKRLLNRTYYIKPITEVINHGNERMTIMDSLVLQRLIASLTDVMDIKLECLKSNYDINLIHERTTRLNQTLNYVFDEVFTALHESGQIQQKLKLHNELIHTLASMDAHLPGPDSDALIERARQSLVPRSQNDPDAVLLAALEILRKNGKECHEESLISSL